jgi:hypothetical protein
MTRHLKLSRVAKAITDSEGTRFDEAERRLTQVRLAIVASERSRASAAGQAALLTAVATGVKVFMQVVLVSTMDIALHRPIPGATTLASAAKILGAELSPEIPVGTSHVITMEPNQSHYAFAVCCWWDRWCCGVRPSWDTAQSGEDWNPIVGIFSAAIAVREVFANVLGRRLHARSTTISLWEPWSEDNAAPGPDTIYVPRRIWIVGLGHLGQGFLWNLGMLPAYGEMLVLQDYQFAGVENEVTGLLTKASSIGLRKTRVAAQWIEQLGWKTELVERKFANTTAISDDDPPIVVAGLDKPEPRLDILNAGFPYMVDCGVGHGPIDFESCQIRVLPRGAQSSWNRSPPPPRASCLMDKEPYRVIAASDQCGAFQLADASVAVPFVGAAVGALSLAQVLRIASMNATSPLLQLELSAPELNSVSLLGPEPSTNIGGVCTALKTGEFIQG